MPCTNGHKAKKCWSCDECFHCPAPDGCAVQHKNRTNKRGRRAGSKNNEHTPAVLQTPRKRRSTARPQSYLEPQCDDERPARSSSPRLRLVERVAERVRSALHGEKLLKKARDRVNPISADMLFHKRIVAEVCAYMQVMTDELIDTLADGDALAIERLQDLRREHFAVNLDSAGFMDAALDIAVRTTEHPVRRHILRMLCSSGRTRKEVNAAVRAAEDRARQDTGFVGYTRSEFPYVMIRDKEWNRAPPWYRRIWQPRPTRQPVGRQIYTRFRKEFRHLKLNGELPSGYRYKSRVTADSVMVAFKVIEELCSEGWSYTMHANKLVGRPSTYLKRAIPKQDMFAAYKKLEKEVVMADGTVRRMINNAKPLGKHTFDAMVNAATKGNKQQSGISYYLEDVMEALKQLDLLVQRLAQITNDLVQMGVVDADVADATMFKELTADCERVRLAVKEGFYQHGRVPSTACDGDAAHCTKHALGHCENAEAGFHTLRCKTCSPAFYVPAKVKLVVEKVFKSLCKHRPQLRLARPGDTPGTYDELSGMMAALALLGEEIKTYHSHVLRAHWQKDFLTERASNLAEGFMEVQVDYMMKVSLLSLRLRLRTHCRYVHMVVPAHEAQGIDTILVWQGRHASAWRDVDVARRERRIADFVCGHDPVAEHRGRRPSQHAARRGARILYCRAHPGR